MTEHPSRECAEFELWLTEKEPRIRKIIGTFFPDLNRDDVLLWTKEHLWRKLQEGLSPFNEGSTVAERLNTAKMRRLNWHYVVNEAVRDARARRVRQGADPDEAQECAVEHGAIEILLQAELLVRWAKASVLLRERLDTRQKAVLVFQELCLAPSKGPSADERDDLIHLCDPLGLTIEDVEREIGRLSDTNRCTIAHRTRRIARSTLDDLNRDDAEGVE